MIYFSAFVSFPYTAPGNSHVLKAIGGYRLMPAKILP